MIEKKAKMMMRTKEIRQGQEEYELLMEKLIITNAREMTRLAGKKTTLLSYNLDMTSSFGRLPGFLCKMMHFVLEW